MRSLLARLAVLGALAVSMSACGGGTGNSLPFAGEPNSAGGSGGTIQSGGNSQMLLRFIQGSPDVVTGANPTGAVDVCIDNLVFGSIGGTAAYAMPAFGTANNGTLIAVAGSIPHVISVYPTLGTTGGGAGGTTAGAECATAPGPYFGINPLAVTTLVPAANASVRWTVVLGGTAATSTFGFYVFAEPTYPVAPAGSGVVSHNAAPGYSKVAASGVGFGTCSTTVTPCAIAATLTGANNIAAPKIAPVGSAPTNGSVTSALNGIPAGFYDGKGVPAGTVTPITSIAAPGGSVTQPYILDLYAIDAPAGGLNLVPVAEQTVGYGF